MFEWRGQTVQIQIGWLLQKPTDLDLHFLLRQGMSCSGPDETVHAQVDLNLPILHMCEGTTPQPLYNTVVGEP